MTLVHGEVPIGAAARGANGVFFRVWCPASRHVAVVVAAEGGESWEEPLSAEENGYFSHLSSRARAGMHYRFRLDGDALYPDPASRFQPEGPHGASRIVDPRSYVWNDGGWEGASMGQQIVYEMHVGTFTQEGTYRAAEAELAELARAGITVLELMPLADFVGSFGWGYDGVNLYAPTRLYGEPDDLRRFVDRAHSLGLAVILDVVYNHLGPGGNYLAAFSPEYFTDRYKTDWGAAINYDGERSAPVREFFRSNAGYWISEFHFDGLRIDATQNIYDASDSHILAEIVRVVREKAGHRRAIVIAENEPQETRLVRKAEEGGFGMDALWNDDYHHSAMVALTGHNEAYYQDHLGSPQEFISALKWGYLYQGQNYSWQKQPRGTPALDVAPAAFVTFLQNHDQVANSARGERCHLLTTPGKHRAMTAMTLLSPGTPMLFQGQEFSSSSPFLFFADHKPELAELVRKGRREFLSQFPSLSSPAVLDRLSDPSDVATFERCKLRLDEREQHRESYRLHCDLMALRKSDRVFSRQRARALDGAVLGELAWMLRFFGEEEGDRLLLMNLGKDFAFASRAEPLLAPPRGHLWTLLWSSEEPNYGGQGLRPVFENGRWFLPAESAIVLAANPCEVAPADTPAFGHQGGDHG